MSPGNENVVTCHGALYKREQKTLPTERRPATPLTLSRQKDESRYRKIDKREELSRVDFGADNECVRADEGT